MFELYQIFGKIYNLPQTSLILSSLTLIHFSFISSLAENKYNFVVI
jgi:hypothetical protein